MDHKFSRLLYIQTDHIKSQPINDLDFDRVSINEINSLATFQQQQKSARTSSANSVCATIY